MVKIEPEGRRSTSATAQPPCVPAACAVNHSARNGDYADLLVMPTLMPNRLRGKGDAHERVGITRWLGLTILHQFPEKEEQVSSARDAGCGVRADVQFAQHAIEPSSMRHCHADPPSARTPYAARSHWPESA